jgi:hypothetical protein
VLWCASCGRIGFDEVDGPVAIAARSVELTTTCGELAPAGTDLTVENRGTSELRIESAAASDGFTVPTQFPLVIAPGGQVAITVTPPRTVIGSDLGGAIKRGTLALVTDSVLPVPAIELAATVVGANITVTGENDETVLAFVSAGNACPIGQRVVLHTPATRPRPSMASPRRASVSLLHRHRPPSSRVRTSSTTCSCARRCVRATTRSRTCSAARSVR